MSLGKLLSLFNSLTRAVPQLDWHRPSESVAQWLESGFVKALLVMYKMSHGAMLSDLSTHSMTGSPSYAVMSCGQNGQPLFCK